ncbi:MAG: hypothetical protein KKB51_23150 [Candidatus Riflebacteria bacterium]|nr:hypothetical protein [Candidatus Riflebacteria bacterium]
MTQDDVSPELTREQLEKMNRLHRRELRQIKNMSEAQFQAFRKNFSFGHLENITRAEAHTLLTSMLTLNLQLLSDLAPVSSDPDQRHQTS